MKILQSFFVTVVILASIYFMAINLEGLKEHEYLAVWAIGVAGLYGKRILYVGAGRSVIEIRRTLYI